MTNIAVQGKEITVILPDQQDYISLTHMVRNYREKPSSLVRDSVRKYRTGNLDKVLNGDFDLF